MSWLDIGRRLPHQWTRSVQCFNIDQDESRLLDICKCETACHIPALEGNVSNYCWWRRSKKNISPPVLTEEQKACDDHVCLFIQTRLIFLLLFSFFFFSLRRTASCCTTNWFQFDCFQMRSGTTEDTIWQTLTEIKVIWAKKKKRLLS